MSVAGDIILSVRDQIPDPVADPADDGAAFTFATLLRWINDANRIICGGTPVIQDWYGIPSAEGMSIYEVPNYITSVEQAWYNLFPLTRSPELNNIFLTKIEARSWWFGPHAIHVNPRIHVWPACDTAGAVTNLSSGISATGPAIPVVSTDGFLAFGFLRVEDELVLYQTVNTGPSTFTNVLRGQGGTVATSHSIGAPVTSCNIFFKCYRLPVPLVTVNDIVELPQNLWPLTELYVLSKVRMAEQNVQEGQLLMKQFLGYVDKLAEKSPQIKGLRQGMQVQTDVSALELFGGHLIVR